MRIRKRPKTSFELLYIGTQQKSVENNIDGTG